MYSVTGFWIRKIPPERMSAHEEAEEWMEFLAQRPLVNHSSYCRWAIPALNGAAYDGHMGCDHQVFEVAHSDSVVVAACLHLTRQCPREGLTLG